MKSVLVMNKQRGLPPTPSSGLGLAMVGQIPVLPNQNKLPLLLLLVERALAHHPNLVASGSLRQVNYNQWSTGFWIGTISNHLRKLNVP